MKKTLFILIAVFTFSFVNAQDISFGVKAGINYGANKTSDADFNDRFDPILVPQFGVFGEFSLSDKFALQPELVYSTSGANLKDYVMAGNIQVTSDLKYRLHYLDIPVMAKYYVADGLSLEAGPYLGFLLSAVEDGSLKVGEDNLIYEADKNDVKDNYKSNDFGMGLGVGYKLENGLYFSLRYNMSLMDINDNPEFTGEARGGEVGSSSFTMSNNIIQFSVGFMFN